MAKEVCHRTNSRLLLVGSISAVKDEYLVRLQSVDCETGLILATDETRAKRKEDIPGETDKLAAALRSKFDQVSEATP